ncbi:MAG: septum formation initiator family protein [Elusimicrobia bacterium]|nr:septum formation initiator family protein [Elusimicrobiota bacterium]
MSDVAGFYRFILRHWARLLLSVFLLTVFFGNQGFRGLVRNWLELRRLRAEIAALEREQAGISGKLKSVRAGDAALERMARRELGFVKTGEIEYRFPPPPAEK